ncbi:hypothetical protein GCM10027570_02680 [Streptomonospora sediminis]
MRAVPIDQGRFNRTWAVVRSAPRGGPVPDPRSRSVRVAGPQPAARRPLHGRRGRSAARSRMLRERGRSGRGRLWAERRAAAPLRLAGATLHNSGIAPTVHKQ